MGSTDSELAGLDDAFEAVSACINIIMHRLPTNNLPHFSVKRATSFLSPSSHAVPPVPLIYVCVGDVWPTGVLLVVPARYGGVHRPRPQALPGE